MSRTNMAHCSPFATPTQPARQRHIPAQDNLAFPVTPSRPTSSKSQPDQRPIRQSLVRYTPGRPVNASPKTPRRRGRVLQVHTPSNGPAGHRKKQAAQDVWRFYERDVGDGRVTCKLCQCV